MLPTMFRFIWPSGYRGDKLKKIVTEHSHHKQFLFLICELKKNVLL
jgi:hypothetical protein